MFAVGQLAGIREVSLGGTEKNAQLVLGQGALLHQGHLCVLARARCSGIQSGWLVFQGPLLKCLRPKAPRAIASLVVR